MLETSEAPVNGRVASHRLLEGRIAADATSACGWRLVAEGRPLRLRLPLRGPARGLRRRAARRSERFVQSFAVRAAMTAGQPACRPQTRPVVRRARAAHGRGAPQPGPAAASTSGSSPVEIDIMGVRSLGVALTAALFTGMVLRAADRGEHGPLRRRELRGARWSRCPSCASWGRCSPPSWSGGKVASGITAELGSMKVTEQIDALRALGVNYVKRLIVPRVLAALLVFPLLTVLADVVGLLGGMLIVVLRARRRHVALLEHDRLLGVLRDFLTGCGQVRSSSAGIVTLIGCYNGLARPGGTEGLGRHHGDRGAGGHGRDHLRLLPHQAVPDAVLVMGSTPPGHAPRPDPRPTTNR